MAEGINNGDDGFLSFGPGKKLQVNENYSSYECIGV